MSVLRENFINSLATTRENRMRGLVKLELLFCDFKLAEIHEPSPYFIIKFYLSKDFFGNNNTDQKKARDTGIV